jgi:predicted DsbA family dithiol-disulfide isomerase
MMNSPIHIDYFTDPLCCWSWAFEPVWRRLRWEFGADVDVRYRMGGLFENTVRYRDPVNEINNHGQLATQWIDVGESTNTPISPSLWESTPPGSSYPACVAVKAAESFGSIFQETYLRQVREAAMLEGLDVANRAILIEIARRTNALLAAAERADASEFTAAMAGQSARQAFRQDLQDARYRNIGRFPSLLIWHEGPRGLLLTGNRPYEAVLHALRKVSPRTHPARDLSTPSEQVLSPYVRYWHTVTVPEIAHFQNCSCEEARDELERQHLSDAIREVASPSQLA